MDEKKTSSQDHVGIIIEEGQRLSRSLLWQLQRSFFQQQGAQVWSSGTVPHYVTSNPYIAKVYAQIVFGWLRDVAALDGDGDLATLDRSQPVYIVELGAGHGRFTYRFLKAFFGLFDESVLKDLHVKYIMTDFGTRTLDHWQSHPQLRPWIEAGRLDLACFDAEHDQTLHLINSGETLLVETIKNPLAVIANYFFDCLRQDVFRIESGLLYESLVTLDSPQPEPDLNDPELVKRVEITYTHQPAAADYYDDPAFNRLLEAYRQNLAQTALLYPIGALRCIRTLCQLARGRLLLISADKGYHHETDLLFLDNPGLVLHGGCFSLMVNYHAIGQYFIQQGGQFLSTLYRHANLDICAFLLGSHPHDYPETRQAYRLALGQGGPDDFYALFTAASQHLESFDLTQLLAYLRLSGWDSTVFMICFPALLEQLENAPDNLKEELYWAIREIWDTYFHIGGEPDVPFSMGMLLYAMGNYPEAIEFTRHSLCLNGPDAAALYNIAMCHYELRQLDDAAEYTRQSLLQNPNFEAAKALRIQLQTEMKRQSSCAFASSR